MTQFNTAYGGMEAFNLIAIPSCTNGNADPVATSKVTVPTGWAGRLDINKCFGLCTTAVVNTSTSGTAAIKVGTTTIGTLSMLDTAAVGAVAIFTPATGYENGVALAAGDVVSVTTVIGTGGSAAGAFTVYFAMAMTPLAR